MNNFKYMMVGLISHKKMFLSLPRKRKLVACLDQSFIEVAGPKRLQYCRIPVLWDGAGVGDIAGKG